MKKKIGVVRFLGTNCDFDVFEAIKAVGREPEWLWFEDRFSPNNYDGLFLPGGFSYGDYLRCGALAARAPVMASVRDAAEKGLPVLGICNGFQILCESGLLPGVLIRNEKLRFVDKWIQLKAEKGEGFWQKAIQKDEVIKLPVAHGEGRFFAEDDVLKKLEDKQQVLCRYFGGNPNGSLRDIAGVTNEAGNVAALMPHPERAMAAFHGNQDGRRLFEVFS